MDICNLLRADYLDIIFDGRNKMYGGYELRRNYARRSRRATGIVAIAAAIGFTVPVIASGLGPKAVKPVEIVITPTILPELPANPEVRLPPPPPPPKIENPAPTIAAAIPRVVPNDEVERPPATVDEMHDNVVSLTTSAGTGDPRLDAGPSEPGGLPGGSVVEPPKPARIIFTKVEQYAAFPGDLNAWLASHLRYPEAAIQADQQGRSIVQFVVNEDGEISDVKIMRGSFAVLDAEALRVVSSMPKWKPARQNGAKVASYFSLPIDFRLD